MDEKSLSVKEKNYQQAARNIFLSQEFFKILDSFSKRNIPIIPLKGIALIQNIYSDIAARYIGDIDILVRAGDVPSVARILNGLGYQSKPFLFNPKKPYSIYLNSLVFGRPTQIHFFVHLHWHILNTTLPLFMYRIKMEEIWQEARMEECKDKKILMMAPHHLIIYLSMHAFNHSFTNISLLYDIQKVVEFYKDELDWHKVINVARDWGADLPLYYALYFTSEILDVKFRDDFLRNLGPKKISKLGKRVISSILENKGGSHNLIYPLYLSMSNSLFKKAKFFILSLIPSPQQLAQIYSVKCSHLIFFYYFKRLGWAVTQVIKFIRKK